MERFNAKKTPIHPKALTHGSVVIVQNEAGSVVVAGVDALREARDRGETTVGAYVVQHHDAEVLIELLDDAEQRGFLWPKRP